MREYRRKKEVERPRLKLVRDADGRLRSVAGSDEIGDIWAEQKRIRLAEAIEEDKRRAEKKAQRQAAFSRLKQRFGLRKARVSKQTAENQEDSTNSKPREVVVNISMPRIGVPRLSLRRMGRILGKRRLMSLGVAAVVALAVAGAGYAVIISRDDGHKQAAGAAGDVLHSDVVDQTPQFQTILPKGKTIEDLGGWTLVSPPKSDPVYAYVDNVNGVQLNVSQQLLPDKFGEDSVGELSELAKQFGASEKLEVDDADVYIGTSAKGPQSVIMAKKDLLILIKSSSSLTDGQWAAYVSSLD